MSKLGIIFAFSLGAAAGTAVTWKVLKSKYEQIAQQEIESVKEVYKKKYEGESDSKSFVGKRAELDVIDDAIDTDKQNDVDSMVKNLGYSTFSDREVKKEDKTDGPYVIAPEEFDEIGYETSNLTYYADGVLADDVDDIIENVDALVGKDSLEAFGEYEDDTVFVRNDSLKTDFEICRDKRNYSDVVGPLDDEK